MRDLLACWSSGRKKGVVFTGGSFQKGVRVPTGVSGVGSGSGGWWGGGLPVENKGKSEGGGEGEGWGRDRQRNRQVNAQALSKLPLANFSLFPPPPLGERNRYHLSFWFFSPVL